MMFCVPCFGNEYVPGQMIVRFKSDVIELAQGTGTFSIDNADVRSSSIKALNLKYKVNKIRSFMKKEKKYKKTRAGRMVELPDLSSIFRLEFPTDVDVKAAVDEYQRDPSVEYASPNYLRKLFEPNDPYYISGEGNPDFGPGTDQWALYKIGLKPTGSGESGWDLEKGTSEVRIAIIDTGINYNHADLANRTDLSLGHNFVSSGTTPPLDDNGHGSHVAGIIGAETNNGIGVAGVNWYCTLVPLKVFDAGGSGNDWDISHALIWAVDTAEADVINMSFGPSDANDSGYSALVDSAISYAVAANCVLVAAAGNNNRSSPVKYPAAYDGVIAVAATDPYDKKASYSNYGTWIDVSAPGGDTGPGAQYYLHWVFSTYRTLVIDDSYTWMAGTSMAAPFVSGLAALLRAKYPTMGATDVRDLIVNYSDSIDVYNPGYAGQIGNGRINAFLALGGLRARLLPQRLDGEGRNVAYGIYNIIGTASGEGFDHYEVDYGVGTAPSNWITIEPHNVVPKVNDVLATLNTTGMDDYLTARVIINDLPSTESRLTFHAGSLDIPILVSAVQYGPNPFDPNKESIMIKYELSNNADVYIYFFDITGNLICRKFCQGGTSGGNQGINRVYWDGKNDFGETVANGVYLFRVASDYRTVGKGKIIVLK